MKIAKKYIWILLFSFVYSSIDCSNSQIVAPEKNDNWIVAAIVTPILALTVGVNYCKLRQQSKLIQEQALEIENLKKTSVSREHLETWGVLEQGASEDLFGLKKSSRSKPVRQAAFLDKDVTMLALDVRVNSLESQLQTVESRLQEMTDLSKAYVRRSELDVYQDQVISELLMSVEKAINSSGFVTRDDFKECDYDGNGKLALYFKERDLSSSGMGSRQETEEFLQDDQVE